MSGSVTATPGLSAAGTARSLFRERRPGASSFFELLIMRSYR